MSALHIPDLSEHQATVDLSKVGPAVILRAHNGYRADRAFTARRDQSRRYQKARAFYLYLLADRDAAAQAHAAAAVIGKVRPGEAVVVDLEEGTGDQSPRFTAASAVLRKETGAKVGLYSGLSFAADHLKAARPDFLWVAAYRSTEPSVRHALWQHTDHEAHPGVGGPCDCSIFHGTANDLLALWGVKPPAPAKRRYTTGHGETVDTVAAKFHLTPSQFRRINKLSSKIHDLLPAHSYRIEP